jgi:2'-5' RNA ligase
MYAIASLLDPATEKDIRVFWRRFELQCGLTGIKRTATPHFTWLGADFFHFAPVEALLQETAGSMSPLMVRATGLCIFTGPLPVITISLVKDAALLEIHTRLWENVRPYSVTPSPFYLPNRWMPHITLAYHEADPQQLGCAIQEIAFTTIDFEFTAHNLALIYQIPGQDGVRNQYQFGKER